MIHVIDDDSVAADAIARTLRETGREVRISTSVTDAIATLAAETPSAVVLDLVLGTDASALSGSGWGTSTPPGPWRYWGVALTAYTSTPGAEAYIDHASIRRL